ncbi:AbrB/MazE/SpoVT family DNA-binding domain-containing protein [Entomobacter blattae]|uniref:Antitoxin MazE n=1 Tax=Entomobacter blattae TaxID=2762277 RepID=A0A7H1NTZ5_9PROT|nr:AbrB/MazE/SpoVT family DNA-binding domain-containing protein [Entomobacter blattae]QNT79255.1 Antitoxin MazE [Entomobacter blattae]
METSIKKWGNSTAIRIPSALIKESGMKIDQAVDVQVKDDTIIIKPIKKQKYALDSLLSGITEDNRHNEVESFGPVGNEEW